MEIHKIQIDSKDVFISQKKDNFKVVKPWKNEDGSINWFNLLTGGSWWNLIIVAFIVLVVLGTLNEYSQNIKMFLDCFNIPGQLEICKEAFGPKLARSIVTNWTIP